MLEVFPITPLYAEWSGEGENVGSGAAATGGNAEV